MHNKRLLIFILSILFFLGLCWWIFHFPFRASSLYRCIPADAVWVSRHADFNTLVPALARNQSIRHAALSLGLDAEDLHPESGLPEEIRVWLDRLAPHMVVAGYRHHDKSKSSNLMLCSWLGGEAIRFRYLLMFSKSRSFVPMSPHHGTRIWHVRMNDGSPGWYLSIALVDGMLLASYSTDPYGVRDMLNAWGGLATRWNQAHTGAYEELKGIPRENAAWFDAPSMTEGFMELETIDKRLLELSYRPRTAKEAPSFGTSVAPLLAGPDGRSAMGLVVADPWLLNLVEPHLPAAFKPEALAALCGGSAERVALSLHDGEFSGRIKGFKVPAAVLAFQSAAFTSREPSDIIQEFLDRLNAEYQLGLIQQPLQVADQRIFVIESSGDNFYASMPMAERVAIAVWKNWLLLSSNPGSLSKLLMEGNLVQESSALSDPRFAVINLRRIGTSARAVLGAYTLKLMFDSSEGAPRQRKLVSEAQSWVNIIEKLGELRLTSKPSEGVWKTTLSLRAL